MSPSDGRNSQFTQKPDSTNYLKVLMLCTLYLKSDGFVSLGQLAREAPETSDSNVITCGLTWIDLGITLHSDESKASGVAALCN